MQSADDVKECRKHCKGKDIKAGFRGDESAHYNSLHRHAFEGKNHEEAVGWHHTGGYLQNRKRGGLEEL